MTYSDIEIQKATVNSYFILALHSCIVRRSNYVIFCDKLRGFVKLKQIQKSEKNSEVGQVPTRICILFGKFRFYVCLFVLFSCFHVLIRWCKENDTIQATFITLAQNVTPPPSRLMYPHTIIW